MYTAHMMNTPKKLIPWLVCLLLLPLSGCTFVDDGYCFFFCYDTAPVQAAYSAQRDQCQLLAERKIALYEDPQSPAPPKQRNTILLALFSECMHGKDWGVTAPKKQDEGGRQVSIRQAAPPIREVDLFVAPGAEGEEDSRVVLPDHMYAQPRRQAPSSSSVQSAPMVGQGIGPGYSSDQVIDEDDQMPEYYEYQR